MFALSAKTSIRCTRHVTSCMKGMLGCQWQAVVVGDAAEVDEVCRRIPFQSSCYTVKHYSQRSHHFSYVHHDSLWRFSLQRKGDPALYCSAYSRLAANPSHFNSPIFRFLHASASTSVAVSLHGLPSLAHIAAPSIVLLLPSIRDPRHQASTACCLLQGHPPIRTRATYIVALHTSCLHSP